MKKLLINISEDEYKWIKEHDNDTTLHQITLSVYNAIRNATVINNDKYVAVDDIIKRYKFHAEEKADREISQILYEVKKYNENEIQ